MMETLLSRGKFNDKGTLNVQLSGGSPWGFTLHGGREFGTKLRIAKITPGGKASKTKVLQVGDEVLSVNNMECSTRAEAIEQVRCSCQSLRITVKRDETKGEESTRQNGSQERFSDQNPLPNNFYKTALEGATEPNDFYSTFSVDPDIYAKITQKSKGNTPHMMNRYDSDLSASNEDLLEEYRRKGVRGSEEELDKVEKSSFSNGRISPNKDLRLPAEHRQLINSLHARAKSWSEHRGHSFPENQLHGRTLTSPGRIQKVKITSSNIYSSSSTYSSPDDEGTRSQSRVSPIKHSPIARQQHVNEAEGSRDNWFERWLRDDNSYAATDKNISIIDACSKYEQEKHEPSPKSPVENKSNFSRSKSFSGRPSYGVVFGTTAVKSDDHSEITTYQAPLPPTRYSSSDLLREKQPVENWQPVEVETSPRKVATIQEERKYAPIDVRMSRKSLGAYPMVSSTSSLDSIGHNDPRRQGPAPPPRRSESKLLSSFRVRGRRSHPHMGGATREAILIEENRQLNESPKHTASNSWPSDYLGNTVSSISANRKSWHVESTRKEEESSKANPAKRSTSVVIRSVRTSTSSLDGNIKPKIYRSSSEELKPEVTTTEGPAVRPKSAQIRSRPSQQEDQRPKQEQQDHLSQQQHPQQQQQQQQKQQRTSQSEQQNQPQQGPQQHEQRPQYEQQHEQQQQQQEQQQLEQQPSLSQHESQSLSSRIEDTQILQKLMKDNQVNSRQTVRSRIQTFEKSSSQPNLTDDPDDTFLLRPRSYHPKQLSWDNSYSAFTKTFTNAKAELRSTGRLGATENRIGSSEHVAPLQQDPEPISPVNKYGASPVKVTSRELAATTKTVMQSTAADEPLQRSSPVITEPTKPVNEHVVRIESASTQEREVYMEEMFKNFDENNEDTSKNTQQETHNNLTIRTQTEDRAHKLSVGDDDVFTSSVLDESIPPPPPPSHSYHETSQDNIPLPTPPREVMTEEMVRTFKQDKNQNTIEIEPVIDVINRYSNAEHSRAHHEKPERFSGFERIDNFKEIDHRNQEKEESLNAKNIKYEELHNEDRIESPVEYNEINTARTSSASFKENSYEGFDTSINIQLDASNQDDPTISRGLPSPLVTTSTPTRTESIDDGGSPESEHAGNTSPFSGSTLSTPSSSRPGSMMSPKLEALDKEKGELVDSMKKKIEDLRMQMNEISDEIAENEKLGEKVTAFVEEKATPSEFSKYQRFTGELNKIVLLLLSLTQRMHRYENTLQELDMSEEADRQQRDILLDKIDHVKSQYQEACKIKEVNDKRGEVVSNFLENYFDEDEFADFQYYIDMKTQLALMHAEIRDKVKMGEERLNTLTATSIDWNMTSFCGF